MCSVALVHSETAFGRADRPSAARADSLHGSERAARPGTELPSIRDLALKHAINPMTVSKVYTLLEAEGVLERHRGKPITVPRPKRTQSPLAKRLEQLEPLRRAGRAGRSPARAHGTGCNQSLT